jgi:BCD family chlorophyll transporter-like MFS transporter
VQATAAGVAVALGGVLRDLFSGWAAGFGPATTGASALGYAAVYAIEIALLLATLFVMRTMTGPHAGQNDNLEPLRSHA